MNMVDRIGSLASIACALTALAAPPAARACSVCGCGDPLLDATDSAAQLGVLRVQLDAEVLSMDSGNEFTPGAIDRLDQYTVRGDVVYSPVDRLALVLRVPLVRKDLRTLGGDGAASELTGLGDVELGARWVFLRSVNLGNARMQDLSLSAGTSLPTGNDDARGPDGQRIDEHGQLGTGAFGPYAGLNYHLDQGRWYAFASLSGRVRTTNAFGYRYGSAVLWSAHGQFRPVPRVALDLGVDGRNAGQDRSEGAPVANTGGLVVAAAPGAFLNVAGPLWFSVRAQVPFYTRLVGEQTVRPTVTTGVQYQLR
jgi:hypothetical protein